MAKYLSQEWLDLYQQLAQDFPERAGANATMQYVITGTPDGDVSYVQKIENGKMLESRLGDSEEADFTLSLGYEDSKKIQKGELDANAAFMQGKLKVTGNLGKLMALMPLTQSPEYKEIQGRLTKQTEFEDA
jgi:putative sterol carrier protein